MKKTCEVGVQTTLFKMEEKKYSKDCIVIDTLPKNARNQGSINLGMTLVAEKANARIVHWSETLERVPKTLMFNVIYATHIFNMIAFLKRHGIEPLKNKRRKTRIIVGGQGVSNLNCLNDIVDEVYKGEYDGDSVGRDGWRRLRKIATNPQFEGDKAVVELARGCKYKCSFCEYGWVYGGAYREKSLELVKKQIDQCVARGVYHVNFMTSNFGGYTKVKELMDYCLRKGVLVLNRDCCLMDVNKIMDYIEPMKMNYLKMGVESFDEKTRVALGKKISDEDMLKVFEQVLDKTSALHFFLIFGLPHDNYKNWFKWVAKLGDLRKKYTVEQKTLFGTETVNIKNIRIEMNITNFEPCSGTPLSLASQVDFKAKAKFLKDWTRALKGAGFYLKSANPEYKTAGGRWGRKQKSYELLMALKTRHDITDAIINAYDNGVGRSIQDKQADKFLSLLEAK